MKTVVTAVRDSAMNAFGQPQFVQATGVAVRGFRAEVNRADAANVLYTNPGDFELWHIADYDDVSGAFVPPPDGQYRLVRAVDLKAADPVGA